MNGSPDQTKAWMGRGWAYPVSFDPLSGTPAMVAYETDIGQSIWIILATAPGERVMRPDFGCGIYELVYDVIDTALLTRVQTEVRDCLVAYEPRIEVLGVEVDPLLAADGQLTIELDYRVRKTNQTGNLVFPFYFREGAAGGLQGARR
jgi:phage baseplate assembly protein W